jgi:hypothetical protein
MSNNDEITDYKKLRDDMDRISAKLWEKERADRERKEREERNNDDNDDDNKKKKKKDNDNFDVAKMQQIIKWVIIGIIILIVLIIIGFLIYNIFASNNNGRTRITRVSPEMNEFNQNEVIIEKIIEKPVYRDKIVEKIIEKPVYRDKIIEKPIYIDKIVEKPVYINRPPPIEKQVAPKQQLYLDNQNIQKIGENRSFMPQRVDASNYISRPVPPVRSYISNDSSIVPPRQIIRTSSDDSSFSDLFSSSGNNQNSKKITGGIKSSKK